jgi:hypothetical protein
LLACDVHNHGHGRAKEASSLRLHCFHGVTCTECDEQMELVSLVVVADTMMIKKSVSPTAIVCRGYNCQVLRSVKNKSSWLDFRWQGQEQ